VANFLLVPLLAYVITLVFPMPDEKKIGLIVLGCAAGAPFLPKLAQNAKGSLGFSVGLMVLLMSGNLGPVDPDAGREADRRTPANWNAPT
jgi:predicted Na+-dependent transporter